jgi:thiol-disulfide isomerase/thioredoxin
MSRKKRRTSQLAQLLIVSGVILLAAVILALKGRPGTKPPSPNALLPEIQIEQALSSGEPTLAFFHSNNCEQCLIMIDIVEQVFPEFADTVNLVDVDVYDPDNKPLLRRVGLQYIPTLVFFEFSGQGQSFVGVMEADALRQQLSVLAGE